MTAAAPTTLTDVARHAGVSRATVSLVLRGSPLVAAGTQLRVREAVAAVGYVYNRGAATMRGTGTKTVGLLVTEIDNPFFAELTAGASAALDIAGYIPFLATTEESAARQDRAVQRLREHHVDGLILCPSMETRPAWIAGLAERGVRLVQVMRFVKDSIGDFAGPANEAGMEALTEHLIRLGHRRIAFAGAAVMHSGLRQRVAGVRAALRRHGLPAPLVLRTPATRAGGAEAAVRLCAMPERPSALMCCNDVVAFGAMQALRERGLGIGRDIAVTGVGDVPEAAACLPGLTTLATNPRGIGREAVRLLLRRIADPKAAPEHVALPVRLVVRGSTGGGNRSGEL
ncbi:LacI family transcriptional regulator [Humitalea rosea]|uniref:LacI family transcriptional regulator n=1 Tax=Humitalea rosea TaxID=990373 RepID=A0A2W7IBC3_9PROT|nr:LacI family DNA-binding transcriptional regulator [Humitalea rosea]PZW43669.1 LacI family transcriptional regulator [Humitalea rosea]